MMQELHTRGDKVCVREQSAAGTAADRRSMYDDQPGVAGGVRTERRAHARGINFDELRVIYERSGAAPIRYHRSTIGSVCWALCNAGWMLASAMTIFGATSATM